MTDADEALFVGLDHLDERYLECRDMRHRWYVSSDYRRVSTQEDGVNPRRGLDSYVERRITCERCLAVRVEAYALIVGRNSWMSLRSLGAHYEYPDGYQLKGLPPGVRSTPELVRGLRFSRQEHSLATRQSKAKTSRKRKSA